MNPIEEAIVGRRTIDQMRAISERLDAVSSKAKSVVAERDHHRETLRVLLHSRAMDDPAVRRILQDREPWLFKDDA